MGHQTTEHVRHQWATALQTDAKRHVDMTQVFILPLLPRMKHEIKRKTNRQLVLIGMAGPKGYRHQNGPHNLQAQNASVSSHFNRQDRSWDGRKFMMFSKRVEQTLRSVGELPQGIWAKYIQWMWWWNGMIHSDKPAWTHIFKKMCVIGILLWLNTPVHAINPEFKSFTN